MVYDSTLDELKYLRGLAEDRLQTARGAMNAAKMGLEEVRLTLWRARRALLAAYNTVVRARGQYLDACRELCARISDINERRAAAALAMRQAYAAAKDAYACRDGRQIRLYAEQASQSRREIRLLVSERYTIFRELLEWSARRDSAVIDFLTAKQVFDHVLHRYGLASGEYQRLRQGHDEARRILRLAQDTFRGQLEIVRARREKLREERSRIARRAGVPEPYCNDVWVTHKSDGTIHVYYGGIGRPNGDHHGHRVLDPQGRLVYAREPFAPRSVDQSSKRSTAVAA